MAGKSVRAVRRTLASLLGVGGLAVLVAVTTAACGSASPTASGATGSPVAVITGGAGSAGPTPGPGAGATSTAPSSSPTTAGGGGSTGGASLGPVGGPVSTPQAQLAAVPAGRKLTPFETAARSAAWTTLYLGLLSQGGACGQYDVVVQQNASSVSVGLVLLPSGGRICPMYVGHVLIEAKLSAPLGNRSVLDLATGQNVPVSLS